jgi:quinol monooxygenase YgiN
MMLGVLFSEGCIRSKEEMTMIYVIATVTLNAEKREPFLEIFRRNIPNVKAEKGCVMYEPTVDVDSGMPIQGELRNDVVTIVEAWESLDALREHAKSPHMLAYREQVKDMVNALSLQVLESA